VPNDELFVSINGWAIWLPWIVFAVIAALASAVLVLFSRSLAAHGRLETLSSELARAVHTDALTGLANRRSLRGRLPQAWAYANRHREPISALMIDCDDFKQINDSYGHNTGDELLRAIAECMRTVFRASDIFGRWGGDEFLAVLPGTDLSGARAAGERLNKEVEALDMSRHGPCEQMTLSVGCASVSGVSTEALIVEADKALYRAKRQGHGHVAALDRV
jgi:diguanylate cyclase (GGDEF)-like protein